MVTNWILNKNYKIGMIIAAMVAVVLVSVPVYLIWMYSPEAVYRRGLASAFWLSLENDGRGVTVARGETIVVPVELHHWKDLDTALYVELRSDGRGMDSYPEGLSVSYDLDSSVISLSKGAVMVQSKNEAARFNPPMVVSSDGEMVVREFGNLTVSASNDVPVGSYNYELSTGDMKIYGGWGGNGQLLTVTVVESAPAQNGDNGAPVGNGNNIPATAVECQQSSLCTYQLTVGNSTTYPINFRMDGTIVNMTADLTRLTIRLKVEEPTSLQVAIPREVLDSREGEDAGSGADTDFAVFVDQINVALDEFSTGDSKWANALGITEHPEKYRILVIPIPEGVETVEIVRTWLA